GLKEKLLAALRGGLKTVLIPKENEKDLADIPANVKRNLEIIPVDMIDQALEYTLTAKPTPIEKVEAKDVEAMPQPQADDRRSGLTRH
ncbi:S16 family serine protease, partial [Ferruginivarius sediminum]